MVPTCRHLMPTGRKCQSPAMRGCAYCYNHARRGAAARTAHGARSESAIDLPDLLDPEGIPAALQQIMNALANNRISARRAAVLLQGIQMIVLHPPQPLCEPSEADLEAAVDYLASKLQTVGPPA